MSNPQDPQVTLKVNGQDIPLNEFVEQLFFKTVNGLVDSLHKIPKKEGKNKIELVLEG